MAKGKSRTKSRRPPLRRDRVLQAALRLVFAGQKVGVAQVSEHIWLVSFMDYDLGYFDDETCRYRPGAKWR